MNNKVTIYYKPTCPYCQRALELLESKKDLELTKIDISGDEAKCEEMIAQAGGRTTVPQIFLNGEHIGGCDDLFFKYNSGNLKL